MTNDPAEYDQYPDSIDPVRFYLRRDPDNEIVGIGCSFPFPHDQLVVAQGDRTAFVETLEAARDVTGADHVEFLDADLAVSPYSDDPDAQHPEEYVDLGDDELDGPAD